MHKSYLKLGVSWLVGMAAWGIGSHAMAQTAYGPGGLFIHPTAFTPRQGTVSLSVSRFGIHDDDGTDHWLPIGLTFSPTDKAQVGALYITEDGTSEGLFAKAELSPDSPTRPAFGIAGSFLTGSIEQSSISAVASHRFMQGDKLTFIGHAGVQWSTRSDIPKTRNDVAFYVGGQLPLGRSFSLVGEAATKLKFNVKAASSIGLMWSGPHDFDLGIAYLNEGRSDKHEFFIGVGVPIGGNR